MISRILALSLSTGIACKVIFPFAESGWMPALWSYQKRNQPNQITILILVIFTDEFQSACLAQTIENTMNFDKSYPCWSDSGLTHVTRDWDPRVIAESTGSLPVRSSSSTTPNPYTSLFSVKEPSIMTTMSVEHTNLNAPLKILCLTPSFSTFCPHSTITQLHMAEIETMLYKTIVKCFMANSTIHQVLRSNIAKSSLHLDTVFGWVSLRVCNGQSKIRNL